MSIKMEPELRDQFMAVAAAHHRPVAQIIRDLMRLYIADTIRQGLKDEDVFHASSEPELFKQLEI
ncbi:MAG: addiction module antitoxin [Methylovulum sp.]|nr:MAG: addiction module antitoxin [Methylovulum sp.]